jgi:ribosomal protein L11 methyltransferase
MEYIQVTMTCEDAAMQEVLIALLADAGYDGFEQQDQLLRALIPAGHFDPGKTATLLQPFGVLFTVERIEEKNWNEEWEKSYQPVVVGDFCAIRAQWHAPMPGVRHELVITPKMSFGTGHHATTRLMVEAMGQMDLRGGHVLDFGTGTGVLAILAEKLGAGQVTAIDHDEWSIANATENVSVNGCGRIRVLMADDVTDVQGPFHLILANINKQVILNQLGLFRQQLAPGGVILLSGLLEDDFEDIENQAKKNHLSITLRMTKSTWICLKVGSEEISG